MGGERAQGEPFDRAQGKQGAIYVNLPNEANVLEWVRLWIGFRDKWLRDRVRQFVTWLRLPELGSFSALTAQADAYIGFERHMKDMKDARLRGLTASPFTNPPASAFPTPAFACPGRSRRAVNIRGEARVRSHGRHAAIRVSGVGRSRVFGAETE
jgi:hypothetical protein